jgi:hypothetical protein
MSNVDRPTSTFASGRIAGSATDFISGFSQFSSLVSLRAILSYSSSMQWTVQCVAVLECVDTLARIQHAQVYI